MWQGVWWGTNARGRACQWGCPFLAMRVFIFPPVQLPRGPPPPVFTFTSASPSLCVANEKRCPVLWLEWGDVCGKVGYNRFLCQGGVFSSASGFCVSSRALAQGAQAAHAGTVHPSGSTRRLSRWHTGTMLFFGTTRLYLHLSSNCVVNEQRCHVRWLERISVAQGCFFPLFLSSPRPSHSPAWFCLSQLPRPASTRSST